MTMEELSNKEILSIYLDAILQQDDYVYILELREEILDRMGGNKGE
jgi:DNA-binding phage protein